jgi:3',5'-cyclic AMP phosphodiesterase CpdA
LSDPYIAAGPLAAVPAAALARALGRALSLVPRPDCVVITGDLTACGRPEEYAALHAILRGYPVPVYLAAGDRDDPAALAAEFGGTPYLAGGASPSYAVRLPGATVIVGNSRVPGSPAGLLGDAQLAWIDQTLRTRPGLPALVCVHHPPARVGMPFCDGTRLRDGAALGEILARHPHVAGVLCGHVHRAAQAPFAGGMLAVAPSTCLLADLRMGDDGPPGYLAGPTGFLLHLIGGRGCVTHTVTSGHASATSPPWQPAACSLQETIPGAGP